jgi:putative membrane protein
VTPRETVGQAMARRTIRAACLRLVARRLELTVEGGEHVPASGPALVAARHVHHLYDGCALVAALPRPVYLLVATDWAGRGVTRRVMERACRLARWPTVLRTDASARPGRREVFHPCEARRALLRATRLAIDLLRDGQLVVVFPEGYPTIDPAGSPKADERAFLPFRPGVAGLATLAERRGAGRVPIVPAGFAYEAGERWRVRLRFGPPVFARDYADRRALTSAIEARVVGLSPALPAGPPFARRG